MAARETHAGDDAGADSPGLTGAVGSSTEYSILLVEDDNVTLKQVEQMLKKYGNYRVTTAMNGRQALQLLKEAREAGRGFDIVLTDLGLPEVSGLEMIHEITDVPVVVMSCQDSQASVLQAFEAGAADYLIKPIRKNEIWTLWQHIWRNNRCKAAPQPGGSPIASAAMPGNDSGSGASTSSWQCDNSTPPCSLQTSNPAPRTTAALKNSCRDTSPTQQSPALPALPAPRHPCSKDQLVDGGELHTEPVLAATASVAAVHFDLLGNGKATAFGSPEPIAEGSHALCSGHHMGASSTPTHDARPAPDHAAATVNAEAMPADSTPSNSGAAPASTSRAPGTTQVKQEIKDAARAGPRVPSAPLPSLRAPLSRPLATNTAVGCHGHPGTLPPGLQELAALGLQRQQHEPGLWQPRPQQALARSEETGAPEQTSTGLNHSGSSAFTAVTVFLPRVRAPPSAGVQEPAPAPGAAMPAPVHHRQRSDQSPSGSAKSGAAGAAPQPATRATQNGEHRAGSRAEPEAGPMPASSAAGLLLPPHLHSNAGALTAVHQPSSAAVVTAPSLSQPGLGQVYLPQSVIQLICALSGPASCSVPAPHAGLTRTTSGSASEASNTSRAAHRLAAMAKYLEKRKIRSFQKKVRYESRKRLADSRPRVKGQFVKQSGTPPVSGAATAQTTASLASGQQDVRAWGGEGDAAAVLAGMADGPLANKRARSMSVQEDEMETHESDVSESEP